MLTKEQLTERAAQMASEIQANWRYWQDPLSYPDPFARYLLAALERVQRETAEECAGLTRTPGAIEVAFCLEPEPYDPAVSDLEEPRG